MKICIFGDSITEGYYDNEQGGWVKRLSLKFDNHKIYNLGVSGDTTEELLKRFDADIANKNPELIIFAIGVNDSIFIPKEKRNFVDFDKFKENIKQLVDRARKFTENIVFIGLSPVDENKVTPMPWEPELHYLNKDVEKYDKAIREICRVMNLKFINISEEMKKLNYKELLTDGVHPNSSGHKWIAEKIASELDFR